ncbi:MAG: hypothetical protein V3W18_11745 [candidate division Zixibacteria bacterium]
MNKLIKIVVAFIACLFIVAPAEEIVITGFPLGIGSDVDSSFFEAYFPQFQALSDTLRSYPLARVIVTGGADGVRYHQNHDSQNPGLAMGRAHALRNLLVEKFNIDSSLIVVQSSNVKHKGDPYRYVSVRITRELADLDKRLNTLATRPPVEKRITEVKEIYRTIPENMGLQLGVGFSSSPFGGIPILSGAITW